MNANATKMKTGTTPYIIKALKIEGFFLADCDCDSFILFIGGCASNTNTGNMKPYYGWMDGMMVHIIDSSIALGV